MKTPPRCGASSAALPSDVAEFQRLNRCPLYSGRLNRWTVRRTLRDKPSDAAMLEGACDAFKLWFSGEQPWGSLVMVNVRALARRKSLRPPGEVAAASETLCPMPVMLGDSFATLDVEFIYFGTAGDMPWPVLDGEGAWRPLDCVWALDLVGVPLGS